MYNSKQQIQPTEVAFLLFLYLFKLEVKHF